jgi:predicted nuclease with TOPRIM domain
MDLAERDNGEGQVVVVAKGLIYKHMATKIELKADIERLQEKIKELHGELSQVRDLVDAIRGHIDYSRSRRPWSASPGQ